MVLRDERELLREHFLLVGSIEITGSPQRPGDEKKYAYAD
jgi:hypothetical protein